MSSRCYPLFVKGNPQLRIFLPNFWMKLVKPQCENPPNQVTFHVSMEMTKHDVRNYLEKIYNVPVKAITMNVQLGEFKRSEEAGYVIKEDDIKVAHVTLPKDVKFEFPNLFPEEKLKEMIKDLNAMEESKERYEAQLQKNADRPGIPSWFGV